MYPVLPRFKMKATPQPAPKATPIETKIRRRSLIARSFEASAAACGKRYPM